MGVDFLEGPGAGTRHGLHDVTATVPLPAARRFARAAPVLTLLVATVAVLVGRAWIAVVLGLVTLGFVHLRRVAPDRAAAVEGRVARAAVAFGRIVGSALSWILLGLVFVVVVVPVGLVNAILRRTPFAGPTPLDQRGWDRREVVARSRRGFGREPRAAVAGVGRPARLLAALALVVALDLVVGSLLAGFGVLVPDDRGDVGAEIRRSAQAIMSSPAIVDEPWAEAYAEELADFELSGREYVPFLVRGHRASTGEFLNTTAEERVSAPPPAEPDARVAFFGGSVMFGVGQRDDHTIPSAFAAAAAEDGVDVEVHNFGFPGYVAWQEFLLLERRLAAGERYDAVVFLDGHNEFIVQAPVATDDPTHNGASAINDLVVEFDDERQRAPGFGGSLGELWDAYARASATVQLVDRLTGDDEPGLTAGATPSDPDEQADAALDVYDRALARVEELVGDDTELHFFWQPQRLGWPDDVLSRLPPGVVDLSDTFAGIEDGVYIDDVHTNEEGARLLAEAMWAEVGPGLVDR